MVHEPGSDRVSEPHRLALRLEAAGADRATIARALEIEAEAVAPLLAIAHRKLASAAPPSVQQRTPEGGTS